MRPARCDPPSRRPRLAGWPRGPGSRWRQQDPAGRTARAGSRGRCWRRPGVPAPVRSWRAPRRGPSVQPVRPATAAWPRLRRARHRRSGACSRRAMPPQRPGRQWQARTALRASVARVQDHACRQSSHEPGMQWSPDASSALAHILKRARSRPGRRRRCRCRRGRPIHLDQFRRLAQQLCALEGGQQVRTDQLLVHRLVQEAEDLRLVDEFDHQL